MILASTLLHFGALFSLQLLALSAALFLFVYIKKEMMNKWFSFAAAAILGLVLLTMVASFVGAICMHCCERNQGHKNGEGREERMLIRGGMGEEMEMMGRHHHMMEMRGEGMDCGSCPEMKGACKEGMDCCKDGKCEMNGKCDMDMKDGHGEIAGKHLMKKDSIKPKK